jgi:hypothetical protein
MGTVAAIRLNPLMRAFYARLRAAGKSSKMALTACMRKLIVVLNAMLRAGDRWSDEGPQRVKISAATSTGAHGCSHPKTGGPCADF